MLYIKDYSKKKLKLTPHEISWLFLNNSCETEEFQILFFKLSSDRPLTQLFWKRLKKVVGPKNFFYKSCRKFYTLGGDFFSFWRFKNEDSRAKKRFSDFAYIIRVFSHGAPNIFFFKKKLQASYSDLLRWFRTIFYMGYGGAGPFRDTRILDPSPPPTPIIFANIRWRAYYWSDKKSHQINPLSFL